jgi:hypothetical protein
MILRLDNHQLHVGLAGRRATQVSNYRKVAAVKAQGSEHRRDWTAAILPTTALLDTPSDRLELPPPSAEVQARKRRRAGRRPFWPANRSAKLRELWGTKYYAATGRKLDVSTAAVFRQALPAR